MKTLTITIVKRDIYNAVAMATAYEGDKGSNLAAEGVEDFYTKAMTAAARLFPSLLRFEI